MNSVSTDVSLPFLQEVEAATEAVVQAAHSPEDQPLGSDIVAMVRLYL